MLKIFKSEIKRVKQQINECDNKLKNIRFLENAGVEKITNEKNKLRDFKANLVLIISEIIRKKKLIDKPFISYFIEEIRFNKYYGELFSEDYFNIVNMDNITYEEMEELYYLHENGELLDLFTKNAERIK